MSRCFAWLAAALLIVPAAARAAETRTYAVIVANNHATGNTRAALRFADDDGARYVELFDLFADRVEIFSVFDADTQRLYPDLVERTRVPSREALLAGLNDVFAAARRDIADGHRVVFYFVYSGHGEIGSDHEGYLHLIDGPWTRGDLFRHVIAASPATVNHVVIDACNAYFLVARRGAQAEPAGDFSGLVRDFLGHENLTSYPNTGVILSTSSAAEVHEWGRIEAGVFSHVLRSALSGAADANRDGAVDYHEVAAFIAAANGALPDRKARLEIFARAPAQNLREPLVRRPPRGAQVVIPAAMSGRYFFEDDRGVRFADFNKTSEVDVEMRLVPRPRYYLRNDEQEIVLEPADDGRLVRVDEKEARPLTLASRGSVNDAYEQYLFAIPFGPQFVAGYKQATFNALSPLDVHTTVEASPLRPWRYVALTVGGGAAVSSILLEAMARSAAASYRNGSGPETDLAVKRGRAESLHRFALVSGGLAVTAIAAGVGLYWFEE
ncbi:MAG: caspase family protein [Myxococcota bacterium]